MVIASSLYTILSYKMFHRDALLLVGGGNLYFCISIKLFWKFLYDHPFFFHPQICYSVCTARKVILFKCIVLLPKAYPF